MTPLTRLTTRVIDPTALLRAVARPTHGAVLLFLGVVREVNDGRGVTGIEYSAYEAMAARELAAIAEEALARFHAVDVAIEHRLGELALEEASVGIAVAHAHRAEAYEASRWIIEELKRRVPIWKREHYVDGTRQWVDPTRRHTAGVAP
jgi:molybdopterin synthase catalytic subunit